MINPKQLTVAIARHFNLDELRALCFELHFDYEELGDGGKTPKIIHLIQSFERQNKLNQLADAVISIRPKIQREWLVQSELTNLHQQVGQPPYKGLNYFTEEDANLFFGRDEVIAKLISRLHSSQILAIVGASGIGKSSIIHAGIIPVLRRIKKLDVPLKLPVGSDKWPIYYMTPTSTPLAMLARTLNLDSGDASIVSNDDSQEFARHILALLNEKEESDRLLLIVDQFEELFTQCKNKQIQTIFINRLLAASKCNVFIIIALRADFYVYGSTQEALRPILEHQQVIINPMSPAELHRAIKEPARKYGWQFEEGLVSLLLEDMGEDPGALPLLSQALLKTWEKREGVTMTLAGYVGTGGIQGAIAETAETLYRQLSETEQNIARFIFMELTELGEGAEDTRRRISKAELITNQGNSGLIEVVLDKLIKARLVTTTKETFDDKFNIWVTVTHEAVIREWPRLRDQWLGKNREDLRTQRQLGRAANEWNLLGKDNNALYRGVRLALAREWAESHTANPLTQEFIIASYRAHIWRQIGFFIVILLIILGLSFATFIFRFQATANQDLAEENADIASTAIVALAEAAQERNNAIDNAKIAETAEAAALENSYIASTRELEAVEQAKIVSSLSLAIASQSIGHEDDMLALLLAIEAGKYSSTEHAFDALQTQLLIMPQQPLILGEESSVLHADWNRNVSNVLTTNIDGSVKMWGGLMGDHHFTLAHEGNVIQAYWNKDGSRILTVGDDNKVKLWNGFTGEFLFSLDHEDLILSARWNNDESRILTISRDRTANAWDAKNGDLLFSASYGNDRVTGTAKWNIDGSRIIISLNGTAYIWDVSSGQLLFSLNAWEGNIGDLVFDAVSNGIDEQSGIRQVEWNNDESRILTISWDYTAKIWNGQTGQLLSLLPGQISEGTWSADGNRLMTRSRAVVSAGTRNTKIWDAQSGDLLLEIPFSHGTWNEDESFITSINPAEIGDHSMSVFDSQTGENVYTFSLAGVFIYQVAWSDDQSRILSVAGKYSSNLETTTIANIHNVEERTLLFSVNNVSQGQWGHNGDQILTLSDKIVRIWNGQTGELISTLTHEKNVISAEWDANRQLVLTIDEDNTARIWRINDHSNTSESLIRRNMSDLISEACTHAIRNLSLSEWQFYFPNDAYRPTCPNIPSHPTALSARISTTAFPTPTLTPTPTFTPTSLPTPLPTSTPEGYAFEPLNPSPTSISSPEGYPLHPSPSPLPEHYP